MLQLLADDTTLVETRAGDVTAQAREYVAGGATELIACGGDGTVCDVAAALVGTSVPLRIVPCGTTNVLAREMGLPVDPLRALRATQHSTTLRTVNTWTAGKEPLVLGAGIGWDARLLSRLDRRYKRALGLGAMVPLGSWLALRYDFPPLAVDGTDAHGAPCHLEGSSVLVSNIRHWGGRNRAFPDANPSDNVLEVIVCRPRNLFHLAAFWTLLMTPGGRPLRLPGVQYRQLTSLSVSIADDATADVHVNGDVVHQLSRHLRPLCIAPSGSLQVIVP